MNTKSKKETAVTAKARKGTKFSYTLSEPVPRVVFAIERALTGRRAGKKCAKPTRRNRRKKRCTRYKRAGRFAQQGVAGANTKKFSGRIGRRKLKPGSYRATLVATDPAGNRSSPKRLKYRVVY